VNTPRPDIVAILREARVDGCRQCVTQGCRNRAGDQVPCLGGDLCDCDNVCICRCHHLERTMREAADEIEWLRTRVDRLLQ
jgi:hypothetical protein